MCDIIINVGYIINPLDNLNSFKRSLNPKVLKLIFTSFPICVNTTADLVILAYILL